jgi:hypothetical protein
MAGGMLDLVAILVTILFSVTGELDYSHLRLAITLAGIYDMEKVMLYDSEARASEPAATLTAQHVRSSIF